MCRPLLTNIMNHNPKTIINMNFSIYYMCVVVAMVVVGCVVVVMALVICIMVAMVDVCFNFPPDGLQNHFVCS